MKPLWTRRRLLQTLWAASGAAALHALAEAFGLHAPVAADDPASPFRAWLPWIANRGSLPEATPTGLAATATPTASATPTATVTATPTSTVTSTATPSATPTLAPVSDRLVLQVHDSSATFWDYASGWWGDYVRQDVVDRMMECGLLASTGASSLPAACRALMPAYAPGTRIAVKVNLNNSRKPKEENRIDACIETVSALIRALILGGIREEDVWVYDAQRPMPPQFYARRRHTAARYFDREGQADEITTFTPIDPGQQVQFTQWTITTPRYLADLLHQATYLINMPLLKRHGLHPVTLGFKNHFGSLDYLGGRYADNPHRYIDPDHNRYNPDLSPLVDINANPNIANKTVLTIGDGLFGASSVAARPEPWRTFGNQSPNSLFFSRDRVAIDCVMADHLNVEWGVIWKGYDYLRAAATRGMGTYDHGDPWGQGYSEIDYVRLEF